MNREQIQSEIDAIIDRLASAEMQRAADGIHDTSLTAEFRALHERLAELDRMLADTDAPACTMEIIGTTWTHHFNPTWPTYHIRAWDRSATMVEVVEAESGRTVFRDYPTNVVAILERNGYELVITAGRHIEA